MRNIRITANGKSAQLEILNPIKKAKIITINPWNMLVVAPPKHLPNNRLALDTGATRVSFKNPNCLSQIKDIPFITALNSIVMPTIPGAKYCI
jgi:hypothetical protein